VTKLVTNVAAFVRDRLLADTKRKLGNVQLALRRYVVERFSIGSHDAVSTTAKLDARGQQPCWGVRSIHDGAVASSTAVLLEPVANAD
jgi:hypothetical protein